MSDHELDRRYADQEFKLRITGEVAEIKSELRHNTAETKEARQAVDGIQKTLKGDGRLDPGLVGQSIEHGIAIEDLRKFLKFWVPIIGIAIVLFADQLSPLIREWIYEKTHLGMFYSPVESWRKDKETTHEKRYIIHKINVRQEVGE